MASKRIERQIDEALLWVALGAGSTYARRRARRLLSRVFVGGALLTGLAVGAGALGLAGGALALKRRGRRTAL